MKKIGIIGAGNIGGAIAKGLINHGKYKGGDILISRKKISLLDSFKELGVGVKSNNAELVEESDIIILAVLPGLAKEVIEEISPGLKAGKHILVSVVSAVSVSDLDSWIQSKVPVVRIMPNTAVEFGESMTCIAGNDLEAEKLVEKVFEPMGSTMIINEKLMPAATILAACGIAFFLRFIRAETQGGIQIGFHAEEAGKIAAQTAKGAAQILLSTGNHPEREIDKVTTPMGCTIAGLNEMEHYGLSSALIKGIITSHAGISDLK
ncbi:MAG: pyrroline-5-carboxylate reductase [Bacteroidales bacterium]|jgi:pyrroline-5-carboxylate reductase|nr:pyrroline-5-carboxylate reductase [Bacteroidales bacterium]